MKTTEETPRPISSLRKDMNAMKRVHAIGIRYMDSNDLPAVLHDITDAALEITGADVCLLERIDRRTGRLRPYIRKDGAPGGPRQIGDAHDTKKYTLNSRSGCRLGTLCLYRFSGQFEKRNPLFMEMLMKLTADILERININDSLVNNRQNTELLYEVVGMLLENEPAQDIIEQLCQKVMQYLGCEIFFNYLVARDRPGTMRLNAYGGVTAEQAKEVETLEFGQAICGLAAYKGERIIVENLQESDDERVRLLREMGLRAYVCHPLFGSGAVIGTLSFGSSGKDVFNEGELELILAISKHVAAAVNRKNTETELKAIADEIREKSKLVTDYFTNISHEFKTPLSIILVDLQLMEYRLRNAGGDAQEQLGKMVDVMRQNAFRLLRLIGNLLDVTKIDAGYMTVKFTEGDIVEHVAQIVESVRNYADNAGIALRFHSRRKRRAMPMDAEKLERVMLNLLSNAIKHTPEGGHIRVSMEHEDCCVTITVQDDGEGIPEEDKKYIFDRFRQVNAPLTRASEGCGIGLSLTKALVELLQGRIWFESECGKGSRFFVQLPMLEVGEGPRYPEAEGMSRDRKVEMEFSGIRKAGKAR